MKRSRSRCALAVLLSSLPLLAAGCRPAVAPGDSPEPSVRVAADSAPAVRTGAAPGTATADDWRGTSPGRAEELFVGRFPGVRVIRLPDGALSIRVRGSSSFRGNEEPLIVIDGTPIEPGGGGLTGINPNDIAKIEVLKDVASTAFYGVRGANGVVLITTKRRP